MKLRRWLVVREGTISPPVCPASLVMAVPAILEVFSRDGLRSRPEDPAFSHRTFSLQVRRGYSVPVGVP